MNILLLTPAHHPHAVHSRINNDDRPDEAFTTERAQRAGRANAASGAGLHTPSPWLLVVGLPPELSQLLSSMLWCLHRD